jgi:hypothetical protein
MIKTNTLVVLCAILGLAVVSTVSFAEEAMEAAAATQEIAAVTEPAAVEAGAAMEQAATETVTAVEAVAPALSLAGEVEAVDAEKSTVTVKYISDEATQTSTSAVLELNADSKISKADQAVTVSDLKAGDKVSVEYTLNGDAKMVVSSVKIGG